jgi:hypothetical protein
MSKIAIAIIGSTPVFQTDENGLEFVEDACIDIDGHADSHGDPYWQRETSLKLNGHSIDAQVVPYIVLPPGVILAVKDVVLGCRAKVTNTKTGQSTEAVVADVGPRKKLGEISCECARRVGLSGNPNNGGTSEKILKYNVWPGRPAFVDGVKYALQPYRSGK